MGAVATSAAFSIIRATVIEPCTLVSICGGRKRTTPLPTGLGWSLAGGTAAGGTAPGGVVAGGAFAGGAVIGGAVTGGAVIGAAVAGGAVGGSAVTGGTAGLAIAGRTALVGGSCLAVAPGAAPGATAG